MSTSQGSWKFVRAAMVAAALGVGALALGIASPRVSANVSQGGVGVDGVATPLGGGQWQYSYNIVDEPFVTGLGESSTPVPPFPTSLTLPFFDDPATVITGGLAGISMPANWSAEFLTADSTNWLYLGALDPNAGAYSAPPPAFDNPGWVLRFENLTPFVTGLSAADGGTVLAGPFTFASGYAPIEGPVEVSALLSVGVTDFFDPPLPGSPNAPGAPGNAVPEPVTAGLGGLALASLLLAATRRKAGEVPR